MEELEVNRERHDESAENGSLTKRESRCAGEMRASGIVADLT